MLPSAILVSYVNSCILISFFFLSVLSSGQAEDECGPCDLWQSDDFAGNGWCVTHTLENRACLGPVFRSVTEMQIIWHTNLAQNRFCIPVAEFKKRSGWPRQYNH